MHISPISRSTPPFSAASFFQRIYQSLDPCTVGFGRWTLDYGSQTPDAESSVQGLASNTCVQSPGILVCLLYMQPLPHHFPEQHFLFRVNEHLRLEFIYWIRHKWQKVDSFFWISRFSSKFSCQQRVCKILF